MILRLFRQTVWENTSRGVEQKHGNQRKPKIFNVCSLCVKHVVYNTDSLCQLSFPIFTAVKTKLFHYYFPRPNLVSFVSLVQQLPAWPSVRQTSIPLRGFLADPSAPRRDVYGRPPWRCTVFDLNLRGARRGKNKKIKTMVSIAKQKIMLISILCDTSTFLNVIHHIF